MKKYGLMTLYRRFKFKIAVTISLVVLELICNLLYPLFIGYTINDLINQRYQGMYLLIGLIIASLFIGASRRFLDSRVYAKVYRAIAIELIAEEEEKESSPSKISARVRLLTELVEFFENSFPNIISSFLGVIGILIIIFTINVKIFILCILAIIAIIIVYSISRNRNWTLNKQYNDELETLVTNIGERNPSVMKTYLKKLMSLNIKLSDLEMINYSIVTLISMAIFLASMMIIVGDGAIIYGTVFSILMYVFDFVEKVIILPLYYQNFIRLQEISHRLSCE